MPVAAVRPPVPPTAPEPAVPPEVTPPVPDAELPPALELAGVPPELAVLPRPFRDLPQPSSATLTTPAIEIPHFVRASFIDGLPWVEALFNL